MKRVKFFGERDLEEFKEYAFMSSDFRYTNVKGESWTFHLDPYGLYGTQVYDYKTARITGLYDSVDKLIENHVFPDGAKFRDVLYGENYRAEEG